MKSTTIYGTVAMVAFTAQLVLAAQTTRPTTRHDKSTVSSTTPELGAGIEDSIPDIWNTAQLVPAAQTTHLTTRPTPRRDDRPFEEKVRFFTIPYNGKSTVSSTTPEQGADIDEEELIPETWDDLLVKVANNTNSNPDLVRHLDRSFKESVRIFTRAVKEYDHYKNLQHLYYPHRANAPKNETFFTMQSSIMLETIVMSNTSYIVPEFIMVKHIKIHQEFVEQLYRNISTLKNHPLLTPQEKKSVEELETTMITVRELLKQRAPPEKEPDLIDRSQFILESLYAFPAQLDLSQKLILVLEKRNLDDQQKTAEELENEILADDIIHHIKSNESLLAAQKLENTSDWNYVYVVQNVYDGYDTNYERLLSFVDAVQDVALRLKICNALFNEMGDHGYYDSAMLLKLTKYLKTGVLRQATYHTIIEAQALLDTICTQGIVGYLRSNESKLVQQRLEMGNNRTLQYAISEIYHHGGDNFELIIRFAKFVQDTELKLDIYETLYYMLNSKDRTSTERLLELTQCVKTDVLGRATGVTATSAEAFLNYVFTNAAIYCYLDTGNLTTAAQMLNMGTSETYTDAVKKLYTYHAVTFEDLLLLAKSTQNLEETLLIYDAIRHEIYEAICDEVQPNDITDLQKLEQLRRSISHEMLLRQACDGPGFNALIRLFQRIIHDEAVGYLRFGNFTYASIVLEMGDEDTYELVVREMYEKSAENFDLLVSFGDYMLHWTPQVSKYFQVLYKVMKTNGRNDTYETLRLIKIIKAEIPYANRTKINGVLTVLNHLLYDDSIDPKESRKFDLAEQKSVNCSDNANKFAVKEIYDQQAENSDVVLQFANFTHDVAVKSKLYNAFNATKNSTHPDRLKQLLRLYSLAKSEYYNSTRYIFDELKSAIFDQVVEPISSSFIKNVTSSKAQQFSNEISKTDIELLYSIYDTVIKNISGNLTTGEILKKESNCLHQPIERMAVHEAITNLLQRYGRLQLPTNETLALAYHMKQVLSESSAYGDIPQYWRSRYEKLKNKLPSVTRTIAFSKVCLKSRHLINNTYIYASEDMYDDTRRYVYAGPLRNKNLTSSHKWRVLWKPSGFCFENDKFNGEYLFSDDKVFYKDNKRQRLVFTRNKNFSSHCNWSLKWYVGKSIRILDSQGGYLYPSLQENYGYVFTDPNKKGLIISKWEVIDCS